MKLNITKIIQDQIITPTNNTFVLTHIPEITSIQLCSDASDLHSNALIFLSNIKSIIFSDLESTLLSINSLAVFCDKHIIENSDFTLIRNSDHCFFLCPEVSLNDAVDYCYKMLYSQTNHYGEIALNTMECLFDNLSKYKKEEDHIIRIARDLLKCPVAFAKSDFSLQRAPSIPRDYYLQAPFCLNGEAFDWDKALSSFYINSAILIPKLGESIGNNSIPGYIHQNNYCKANGCQIFIFPILDYSVCYGYLLLSVEDYITSLDTEKSIILQQIKYFFKYEVTKSDEIAQTINRYYDFILDELIESEHTDFEKLMQKYGLVKKLLYKNYYVLAVSRNKTDNSDLSFYELLTSQQFNIIFSKITNTLNSGDFFLFERKDYFIMVVPSVLMKGKESFFEIERLFRDFLAESYMGTGVSKEVPVENVRSAYFQARKSLSLSSNTFEKETFFYEDLGILAYFFDNSNNVDATPLMDNYRSFIQPLKNYDQRHTSELLETLKVYVESGGSPTVICKNLAIHKNTLYSRLNKISSLIGKELSDNDVLFNITLGLKTEILIETGILQNEIDP